jgi:hypothetical protein
VELVDITPDLQTMSSHWNGRRLAHWVVLLSILFNLSCKTKRMDSFSSPAPNLDLPAFPVDLPYLDWLDYYFAQILVINGIDTSHASLLKFAKKEQRDAHTILIESAAHVLGSHDMQDAEDVLAELSHHANENVALEAQYALFRIQPLAYPLSSILYHLDYDIEAYLSPGPAAGYLAREGNAIGYGTVLRLQASASRIMRMDAAKQLYFFYALDGQAAGDGTRVDAHQLIRKALDDKEPSIRFQALSILQELPRTHPQLKVELERYTMREVEYSNLQIAKRILASWP